LLSQSRGSDIARLEELTKGALVSGVVADRTVTVIDVAWHGSEVVTLTYRTADGTVAERLVYRDDEPRLAIVEEGKPWAFDGEGEAFKLASEAKRIDLAYLFDPYVAVSTSLVEPLPHQITAVYEAMLSRQPLSFLLADDPGAGKTIMTGLFIRELIVRGDLRRCLVVTPGSLVEQWQAELAEKFHLDFTLLTRDRIDASGNGGFQYRKRQLRNRGRCRRRLRRPRRQSRPQQTRRSRNKRINQPPPLVFRRTASTGGMAGGGSVQFRMTNSGASMARIGCRTRPPQRLFR